MRALGSVTEANRKDTVERCSHNAALLVCELPSPSFRPWQRTARQRVWPGTCIELTLELEGITSDGPDYLEALCGADTVQLRLRVRHWE